MNKIEVPDVDKPERPAEEPTASPRRETAEIPQPTAKARGSTSAGSRSATAGSYRLRFACASSDTDDPARDTPS